MGSEHKHLITIVGASGHQGGALIPLFYHNKDFFCRLVVHSDHSRERLQKTHPNAEVLQADLSKPPAVKTLFADATHYWHVGPPFDPHEAHIGQVCVEAAMFEAKRPGNRFQHLIYSSGVGPQLSKLMHHQPKLFVEELVMESGVNYTIVQPVNLLEYIPVTQIIETGEYHPMQNPDVAQSVLTTKDLADAVYKIVKEGDKHYYAVYPLVSSLPVKYRDICGMLEKALGKEIRVVYDGFDRSLEAVIRTRFGDHPDKYKMDAMERMLLYYNRYGVCGSPTVLEWLLERKRTSPEEWIEEQVKRLK